MMIRMSSCGYRLNLAKAFVFGPLPFVFDHKLWLCNVEKRSIVVEVAPLVV